MKPILIFSILVMLLIQGISLAATSANKLCVNNSTLQVNNTYQIKINTENIPVNTSKEIYCYFGCLNDSCNLGSIITLPIWCIMFGTFVIFMFVGFKWNLDPMVIVSGLLLMLLGIFMISQGVVIDNVLYDNAFSQGMGYTFVATSLYVIATVFI